MNVAQRTLDVKSHNKTYVEFINYYLENDLIPAKEKYRHQALNESLNGNYKEAYNLYKKGYPNIESDTISSIDNKNLWDFPNIIFTLKKLGRTKKANQLISLLEKEYKKQYQFGGDYKKEPWVGLNNIRRLYILKEDYKRLAELMEYIHFVKKDKSYFGRLFSTDILAGIDFNNPYLKAAYAKIEKDKEQYRLSALYYLKQQTAIKD